MKKKFIQPNTFALKKHFKISKKKITKINWECSVLQRKEIGFRSYTDQGLNPVTADCYLYQSFG